MYDIDHDRGDLAEAENRGFTTIRLKSKNLASNPILIRKALEEVKSTIRKRFEEDLNTYRTERIEEVDFILASPATAPTGSSTIITVAGWLMDWLPDFEDKFDLDLRVLVACLFPSNPQQEGGSPFNCSVGKSTIKDIYNLSKSKADNFRFICISGELLSPYREIGCQDLTVYAAKILGLPLIGGIDKKLLDEVELFNNLPPLTWATCILVTGPKSLSDLLKYVKDYHESHEREKQEGLIEVIKRGIGRFFGKDKEKRALERYEELKRKAQEDKSTSDPPAITPAIHDPDEALKELVKGIDANEVLRIKDEYEKILKKVIKGSTRIISVSISSETNLKELKIEKDEIVSMTGSNNVFPYIKEDGKLRYEVFNFLYFEKDYMPKYCKDAPDMEKLFSGR